MTSFSYNITHRAQSFFVPWLFLLGRNCCSFCKMHNSLAKANEDDIYIYISKSDRKRIPLCESRLSRNKSSECEPDYTAILAIPVCEAGASSIFPPPSFSPLYELIKYHQS